MMRLRSIENPEQGWEVLAQHEKEYQPTDTPFGCCCAHFYKTGAQVLEAYSLEALEEYHSIARARLDRPACSEDGALRRFAQALQRELDRRLTLYGIAS